MAIKIEYVGGPLCGLTRNSAMSDAQTIKWIAENPEIAVDLPLLKHAEYSGADAKVLLQNGYVYRYESRHSNLVKYFIKPQHFQLIPTICAL